MVRRTVGSNSQHHENVIHAVQRTILWATWLEFKQIIQEKSLFTIGLEVLPSLDTVDSMTLTASRFGCGAVRRELYNYDTSGDVFFKLPAPINLSTTLDTTWNLEEDQA
jgi:hypothetical protein